MSWDRYLAKSLHYFISNDIIHWSCNLTFTDFLPAIDHYDFIIEVYILWFYLYVLTDTKNLITGNTTTKVTSNCPEDFKV
jgi:hypothetical protein